MNVRNTLTSLKNDNIYTVYEDKIVVQTGARITEIRLPGVPEGQSSFVRFDTIYYMQSKLWAILITSGGGYDMRIEIDEDKLEFVGKPIPTY